MDNRVVSMGAWPSMPLFANLSIWLGENILTRLPRTHEGSRGGMRGEQTMGRDKEDKDLVFVDDSIAHEEKIFQRTNSLFRYEEALSLTVATSFGNFGASTAVRGGQKTV